MGLNEIYDVKPDPDLFQCAHTCVCSAVTLEFVATGESLATVTPRANEGSLSWMPAQVSSEVRRLTVHLTAPWDVTNVLFLLSHTWTSESIHSFKTVLEKIYNLAVRTGFVPLHQHVHYLPPASLQLGQVQATLRSLFPSRPVPSLSSSTNRTCRCDKSLVFRVEFDQSSDSGSSLIWIPAQTERGQSFKKRPQNNQESPQNKTAIQYIYKKVFQD